MNMYMYMYVSSITYVQSSEPANYVAL